MASLCKRNNWDFEIDCSELSEILNGISRKLELTRLVYLIGNTDAISNNKNSISAKNAEHIAKLIVEADNNADATITSNAVRIKNNVDALEDNADSISNNTANLENLTNMPDITALQVKYVVYLLNLLFKT